MTPNAMRGTNQSARPRFVPRRLSSVTAKIKAASRTRRVDGVNAARAAASGRVLYASAGVVCAAEQPGGGHDVAGERQVSYARGADDRTADLDRPHHLDDEAIAHSSLSQLLDVA